MPRTWRYVNHRALDAGIEDFRHKCEAELPKGDVPDAVKGFRHALNNALYWLFAQDPDYVGPNQFRPVLDPKTGYWRVFLENGWYIAYRRVDDEPVGTVTFMRLAESLEGFGELLEP